MNINIVCDLCTKNSKQNKLFCFSTVQKSKRLNGLHSKLVLCTLCIVCGKAFILDHWCPLLICANSKFDSNKIRVDLLPRLECHIGTILTQAFLFGSLFHAAVTFQSKDMAGKTNRFSRSFRMPSNTGTMYGLCT